MASSVTERQSAVSHYPLSTTYGRLRDHSACGEHSSLSTPFPFFSLPPELQLRIFSSLCQGSADEHEERKAARISFLHVDKDTYHDFAPEFYQKAVFVFDPEARISYFTQHSSITCLWTLVKSVSLGSTNIRQAVGRLPTTKLSCGNAR